MGVEAPAILTFHIPQATDDQSLRKLALKYKHLRLTGLELSPEAFSSTLAAESQFSEDVWTSRLSNSQLQTFICALCPAGTGKDQELDVFDSRLEWIAQATLRGPLSIAEFTLPVESGQAELDPFSEHTEERWQFLGLYNLPSFRGKGLARKLCQAALQWLEQTRLREADAIQTLRVRTIIKPDNQGSLALFKKLGFADSALCTLAEALLSNGETVPEDWNESDPRRHRRYGCVLSLTLNTKSPV